MSNEAKALDDPLDQLEVEVSDAPETEQETPALEPADPAPAPIEPAVEPPAAEDETPTPPEPEQIAQQVPLPVVLDERDKRQKAEREAETLRQQLAQQQQQLQQFMQPPQGENLDPLADPDTFNHALNDWKQNVVTDLHHRAEQARLNGSEMMVRQAHDSEEVDAAFARYSEAVRTNPALHQQIISSVHPWDEMMKWSKREAVLETVGDVDAYRSKIEAEVLAKYGLQPPQVPTPNPAPAIVPGAATQQAGQQPQPVTPPAPAQLPRSLANAPGSMAGSEQVPHDPDADPLDSL